VFADLSALVPLADRGLLRLIAVAGAARSPKLPTVPTVGEQGFPELAIEPWYGLMAPRDTASSIIAILNDALIATLRSDEIREQFDHLGYSRIEATPEQMQNLMQTELRSFATFIDPSRLRPER
jgi:tripartite-type tricarboxylate transporter receptor subunit TctC